MDPTVDGRNPKQPPGIWVLNQGVWAESFAHQHLSVGFLRGACSRGGGNWGTLRIPAGSIGEP